MSTFQIFSLLILFVLRRAESSQPTADNGAQTSLTAVEHQGGGGRVAPCGEFCQFRMCNTNGTVFQLPFAPFTIFGAPNTAPPPFVCRPGEVITEVRDTDEARVFVDGAFIPISRWRPRGLRNRFPPNFISTQQVTNLPYHGITHRATVGNQWDFLHDQCMILPIRTYVESIDGVQIERNASRGLNACVAFRTTAPDLHLELTWNSADDFDLAVTEPDRETIEWFSPRTASGKLNGDNGVGLCGRVVGNNENVVYFPRRPIESGRYTASITHFQNCTAGRNTDWRLRVLNKGVVAVDREGTSRFGNNTLIAEESFNFP